MTPEEQRTALRLLKTAARGHPFISNGDIQEINSFIAKIEKKILADSLKKSDG